MWRCSCDCGAECLKTSTHLTQIAKNGRLDAGCRKCAADGMSRTRTVHGAATRRLGRTRLYRVWNNMVERCRNPRNTKFAYYGGKGIRVCEDWRRFEGFRDWATAHGYSDELTIDRVDPNGHYDPTNCEWVPLKENQRRAKYPGHYWRSMTCDSASVVIA